MDGNISISTSESESETSSTLDSLDETFFGPNNVHTDQTGSIPKIATYNLRSLYPKINHLKTDILERSIDVSFLQEIWEPQRNDDSDFDFEIEKLFEVEGLQYISSPRPANYKGVSYGGVALIVNSSKFQCKKLSVSVPKDLEVIWALAKPKTAKPLFKTFILCSFYSPPDKQKNSKLCDHIVTTLHMLYSKYPESGIILGADINGMDISPILKCGLKLRQIVDKFTRGFKILDILITNISRHFHCPIIFPPINPDDPKSGKPSDHSVPVCQPHTDKFNPPVRNYRIVNYRPLPESSVKRFGEWIVSVNWDSILRENSTSDLAMEFETLVYQKLDEFCPEKVMKFSSYDKPFITKELKEIDRKKKREYQKRGKTRKYLILRNLFRKKYKSEAQKYVDKTMTDLKESKPGRMYGFLKRLGSEPSNNAENNTFTLPEHESLGYTAEQSAEVIAQHFAKISRDFPPLSEDYLPTRVVEKLKSRDEQPPYLSDYEVWRQIVATKKPRSGVPKDLPKTIIQEFAPEIATPLSVIINRMLHSGVWPDEWKLEYVTPIGKKPYPESEDDLRPISLTPFYSKVAEKFVSGWLLDYIGDKLDIRQYGGLKGSSTTHYIIELVNFILAAQDSADQTAVLACLVDFSKAFNRQDHNILITKLCDMGVPGWLLRLIKAFLDW